MKLSLIYRLSIILVAVVLVGCSGAQAAQSTPAAGPEMEPVLSNSSIIAEGRVVPGREAELSFAASGVTGEVLVAEGDLVKAGQPLARLKGNEQLQASVAAAEMEVLQAEQAIEDLNEQAALLKAQAQLALVDAQKELDKVEKRLLSREYQRGGPEQVDIARANYILAEDGVTKATDLYDQVDDRGEDDPDRASALSQMAAARQTRDVALANLNYLLSKPNELDVARIDAEVALARVQLAKAEQKVASLEHGPDADELSLAQARLKNAQASLAAARANLLNLELNAPIDGTLSSFKLTAGEFVSPGTVVAVVSDQVNWMVETTDLTELNIARVQPGMPAIIRFDALPDFEVIGRVVSIYSVGENRQGDIVYTVTLNLEQSDPRLRWNMTASVTFLEKVP